jgi:hypothetical protein
MLNWGNGIQAGPPAAAELMAKPVGLSPLIVQPTKSMSDETLLFELLSIFVCCGCREGW